MPHRLGQASGDMHRQGRLSARIDGRKFLDRRRQRGRRLLNGPNGQPELLGGPLPRHSVEKDRSAHDGYTELVG
jgi:hypothetical protein